MDLQDKNEITIQWSKVDNILVARVSELKFCTVHGDTQEEALRNIKDAVTFYIRVAITTVSL